MKISCGTWIVGWVKTAMKIATTQTKTAKTKIAYVYQIYVVYIIYRMGIDGYINVHIE